MGGNFSDLIICELILICVYFLVQNNILDSQVDR